MSSTAYNQGLLDEKEISENDKRCSGNIRWCLFGGIGAISLMLVMMMVHPTLPGPVPFSQELVSKGQIPRMTAKDLFSGWQSSINASELHRMTLTLPFRTMNVTASAGAMLFAGKDYLMSSPGPVSFPDIEAGVLYMAKFVADPNMLAFGPPLKTFWSRLVDPNRVHHIFADREGHHQLHNTPPTDLDIVQVVTMLYDIAVHGTEIAPNLRAAVSLNLFSVVVVQTWEGSLTDAWVKNVEDDVVNDVIVNVARVALCGKTVAFDSLGYACSADGRKF